jgi:uncharacterized protein YrrD
MLRYELVKGLPVVTMGEGKTVGKVDELVVDPDHKEVSWLRLHSGGLFGERVWVSTNAVHAIGIDAVTINGEGDVRTPPDVPEAEALAKSKRVVVGTKAITESGERLGEVRDFEFLPNTFALTKLFVPPGLNILGQYLPIAADKVITIGEDVIVVADDAVIRREEAEGEAQEQGRAPAQPTN